MPCCADGSFPEDPNGDAITGSRSLLPSSESDSSMSRHTPWKSMDEITPGLPTAHTSQSRPSPERRQKSSHYGNQAFADIDPIDSSIFSMAPGSTSLSSRSSQRNFLDPTSRDFVTSENLVPSNLHRFSRQNSGEEPSYGNRKGDFLPSRPSGSNNISGYNSSVGSRAGSLPPSRSDIEPSSRVRGDVQNLQHARFGQAATAQRSHPSVNARPFIMHSGPYGQRIEEQQSPTQLDNFAGQFDQLNVGNPQRRPSHASSQPSPNSSSDQFSHSYAHNSVGDTHDEWGVEANGHPGFLDRYSSTSSGSGVPQNQYRGAFGSQFSHSPSDSDARLMNHQNSFYPSVDTPPNFHQQNALTRSHYPGSSTAQAVMLERRLRGLQQQQQSYMMSQQNPSQFRHQVPYSYDTNAQQTIRMNSLNSYYPMPPGPHLLNATHVPRGPSRDHDLAGHLRSPLLEEFRSNGKTNKRYELKVERFPVLLANIY